MVKKSTCKVCGYAVKLITSMNVVKFHDDKNRKPEHVKRRLLRCKHCNTFQTVDFRRYTAYQSNFGVTLAKM